MFFFLFTCVLATNPTFKLIDDLKKFSLDESAGSLTKSEALRAIEISRSFVESIDTPTQSKNSKKLIDFLGARKDSFICSFNSLLTYADKMVEGDISREHFNETCNVLLIDLSELFGEKPDILNEFIKLSNEAYESKINSPKTVSE